MPHGASSPVPKAEGPANLAKRMGAPGPSHLGTWEITNPSQPRITPDKRRCSRGEFSLYEKSRRRPVRIPKSNLGRDDTLGFSVGQGQTRS
jgi:hypothetical protein